ncbi:MAG: N-acetylmuramoyl-L-alanine amidase [Candidatus Ozemobacter sibiricus]|jgi:hypothetical protein|uniref:N-acetylmuramoyl-L-alanine amidase n=1 Tax=Candidatus Ozemobacter sibiricus TaxID=2268124 RepID=A0A367ZST0_9BACT|nr:MAG: N-acetylmuramoyl-L-alanine amidase [Candidatus Ozemobacter sibiricus]
MRASTILCLVLLCLWVQLPALAMFEDADDIVISAPKEVSTSDAAETPPPPPTQSATKVDQVDKKEDKNKEKRETKTITHKVTRGDTLWGLAKKYLGDGSRYMEIVKANAKKYPGLLKNPDLIIDGWELVIPIPGQTSGDTQPSDTKPSDTKPGDTNAATGSTTKPTTPPATTKPLTVEQKILKLQEAVNRMNMALLAQGKTLTELNTQTVRLMIDKGIITEEEWMSLNPPEGYRWVIEKGKVKLVNRDGQPITNAESAKVNEAAAKEAAEKAKAEAEKAAKEAAEKAAKEKAAKEAAEKAKAEAEKAKTAAEKAAKEKAAKEAAEKAAKEAAEKAKAEAEKAAKEKAAKEAAEKAAKEKAAKEAAEKAKADAEKAKSHAQKNYEADLAKIGMPNILGQERAYLTAIDRAATLNPKYNQFSPFNQDPFGYGYAAPGISLHTLQYQLFEAQKLYEEMVAKNDTEKFLGIFGNDIESAAKKVKECRERLAKAWSDFQKVHNESKQQVAGIKSDIAKIQEAKKAAEDKLAKLDRYNPDNGPQVQALLKEIKAKDEEIAKLQKKAGYLDDLLKLFP